MVSAEGGAWMKMASRLGRGLQGEGGAWEKLAREWGGLGGQDEALSVWRGLKEGHAHGRGL